MKGNIIDYMEMAQGARYGIEKESDRLTERLTQMEDYKRLLDGIDEVLADNKRQQGEIESLQQQLAEERQRRADVEMKLAELNKLTAGVARKASEEVLLKTIQSYVNKSKQKRPEKRVAAKEWALEMVLANKLNVPEELAEAIEHLDDEQPEAKVVNVGNGGQYNDIHDNTTVNQK